MAAGRLPAGQRCAAGYPLAGTVIAASMLRLDFESGEYAPGYGMYQVWEAGSAESVAAGTPGALVIGDIGFHGGPDQDGVVEIGYGLAPSRRGQGFMTEALRALVTWAMRDPQVEVVMATTDDDNRASQRVLRAAGFTETDPGGPQRCFVYRRRR